MPKLYKDQHPYFTPILIVQVWLIIEMILNVISYSSQLVSLVRYLVFFVATVFLMQSLYKYNEKINLPSKILFLWIIWMFVDSIPFLISDYRNYLYLKQFISGIFFMYITIFLIAAKLDIQFYRLLFKFSYLMVLIYVIITVPFFPAFVKNFTLGAEGYTFFASMGSILLLTLSYHTKKKQWVIILSVVLAIVLMMILARRNKVLYFGSILFFAYLISFFSKPTFIRKINISTFKALIVVALFLGMLVIVFSESFDFFWERMDEGMTSRESIISLFVDDFNNSPQDWFWGRGIFGQFEGGLLATDENTGLRDGIENGYYQTILKGGGVFLVLLTIISINAAYKGFFKSNNLLCKGFAAIIIVFYISMIGMNQYGVSLKSIIVYVSIAACNSWQLRSYTDEYLSQKIGLN